MKLESVRQVAVFYERAPGRRLKVGRLALKDRKILFEYDAGFLGTKLELSPFHLPLSPGVVEGNPSVLDGLMGVFDDSLPDGWGRLLIDRRAAELGISALALSPLDRLSLVGARSMGALVYEPEAPLEETVIVKLADLAADVELVLRGARGADLERLIAIGGSPKGARPKALVQIAPNGDIHFGARSIEPGFSSWLVKFPARDDNRHAAPLEHAYCLMAAAAKIEVPATRLLGTTKRTPGFFAIERFDRDGGSRVHMHTLGGLLAVAHGNFALDYRDLLRVTRELTRDEAAVAEMFRRACFNVFAHNRDDHSRNFAFLMDDRGRWRPSPAYDLTFAAGPNGEHSMLVSGEGTNPTRQHLLALASDVGIKKSERIIDEVQAAVAGFETFADEAGVPTRPRQAIAKVIKPASRAAGAARGALRRR